jgi:hypothetical protein
VIVFFADGPLNGQWREIPSGAMRWRVPLHEPMTIGYWEASDPPVEVPGIRVGYYEPTGCHLKTGAMIYVFGGVE